MTMQEGLFVSGGEEGAQIIQQLFEVKDLDKQSMTTEIPPELIFDMAVLLLIADRFASKLLKNLAKFIFQIEVSKDRKGRLELVEAWLSKRTPLGDEGYE